MAPANQDMDYKLTRPFPKLVHAPLSQEEQLFQGLHPCIDLALFERLTESLPDLGEVLNR